jgi:hypothetical protein
MTALCSHVVLMVYATIITTATVFKSTIAKLISLWRALHTLRVHLHQHMYTLLYTTTAAQNRKYYELGKLQPDLNAPHLVAKRENADRVREFSENLAAINRQAAAQQRRSASAPQQQQQQQQQQQCREKKPPFHSPDRAAITELHSCTDTAAAGNGSTTAVTAAATAASGSVSSTASSGGAAAAVMSKRERMLQFAATKVPRPRPRQVTSAAPVLQLGELLSARSPPAAATAVLSARQQQQQQQYGLTPRRGNNSSNHPSSSSVAPVGGASGGSEYELERLEQEHEAMRKRVAAMRAELRL